MDMSRSPLPMLASAATVLFALSTPVAHAALPTGFAANDLEALTSVELRERIAHGSTTVIVPIGGEIGPSPARQATPTSIAPTPIVTA